MNIVMITENDPAGMGIVFTRAVNSYSEHHCRLITTKTRYNFNFAKDLHLPDLGPEGFEEIHQLLTDADIIHFHILADENIALGPIEVKEFIKGKTILHHHHGHPDFRAHPDKYKEKYRRLKRKVLVSTPDLLRLLPEAMWQPNLVPVNDPLYIPQTAPLNGKLIIGQAVTRKDLKNTKDLLSAVADIQNGPSTPNVEVDIIENTDHHECLRRKNRCHIIFDHMQGYYGVSSLESLSQGKPVLAGLDDWNIKAIKELTSEDELPWVIARSHKELKKVLGRLLLDTRYREEVGLRSRQFMETAWTEERVLERLLNTYNGL